jgi:uncharacterized membrane protein
MLKLVIKEDKTMNNKRAQILDWQQSGHITNDKVVKSLELSQANNTPNQWFEFIRLTLLWLGVLSLASGVVFFFAYNWNEMSTILKFALLQTMILLTLVGYSQTKSYSSISTALLFLLALLIGALLALFGQTYQTGKDPWQLFAWWTVLVIPLAVLSKSSSLWILVLALANLSLSLYLQVRHGIFGYLFRDENEVLIFAILNATAAVVFELLYSFKKQIKSRYAGQLALVAAMVPFSWLALFFIFESTKSYSYFLIYILWMLSVYYFYRLKTLDVMILSSWVVSGIFALISTLGRLIDDDLDGGTFLLLGVILIMLSTLAGKWLMGLLKEAKAKESGNV